MGIKTSEKAVISRVLGILDRFIPTGLIMGIIAFIVLSICIILISFGVIKDIDFLF